MRRNESTAIMILFVVLIIALIALGIWYYGVYQMNQANINKETNITATSSATSATSTSDSPSIIQQLDSSTPSASNTTYISQELGLSFEYFQDGHVIINESGTILMMCDAPYENSCNTDPDDFIEVFKKNPNTTFQQSVADLFKTEGLINCSVGVVASGIDIEPFLSAAFNEELAASDDLSNSNCTYESVNYIPEDAAQFGYNTQYPDRFYFYDFGEALDPSLVLPDGSQNGDWRSTIRLINSTQK